MNKKSIFLQSMLASSLLIGFGSCKSNSDPIAQPYDKGVMILNEGNFSDNNGSISFLSKTIPATISYDIFKQVNLRSVSGGLTDYTEVDGKGLLLVDNSTAGKDVIEIVNASTFKSMATISGQVENPRHVIRVGANKAYVSCWDVLNADYSYKAGYVAVIDLTTNQIIKKIQVQNGCEDLCLIGNEVFVGNVFSNKTAMSVIDITKDAVSQTSEVGTNPSVLKVDANGKLWIYANNQMIRLNPQSKVIETKVSFGANVQKEPSSFSLSQDKKTFYFVYSYYDATDGYTQKGETYSFNISDLIISTDKPFIKKLFAGLGIDPDTGNIYGGFVPSFKQAGYVFRFQNNGTLIDSVKAEISPNSFYFK